MSNFIVGANQTDYHYKNVNTEDFKADYVSDIVAIQEGDKCPICGGTIKFAKGIEIGNTFKLGTKYAKALGLNYLDKNGKLQDVVMGSYGIGIGRCMAALVEQNHDERGIKWPINVAPYQVAIVLINLKEEKQVEVSNQLYDALLALGIDVLLDDRDERAGVKFNDMDLIGIPFRVTVGKGVNTGVVEFKQREADQSIDIEIDKLIEFIQTKLTK